MPYKNQASLLKLTVAAEMLGLTPNALHGKRNVKYKPFISGEGKNRLFDISGYLKLEDLKTELTEKVRLLTEYLFHIEGLNYSDIARLGKVAVQNIWSGTFSFEVALKVVKAIRDNRPQHFKRFHLYYSYPYTAPIRDIW